MRIGILCRLCQSMIVKKGSYTHFSDPELFDLVRKHNADAFSVLYQRYWGLLYIHALKMLHDEEQAKDLLQELFVWLWDKAPNLEIKNSISTYLYSAVRHKILNLIEHNKVKVAYGDYINRYFKDGKYVTDEKIRENEMRKLIEQEVNQLPSKMRLIFLMSHKDYLSHKEIALKLGLSEKTVKTQVNNALRVLRDKLKISPIVILFFMR